MIDTLKLVWARIPKKRLSSILTFIIGYFGKLLLDYFLRGEPFKFNKQAFDALIGSGVLLVAYFILAFIYQWINLVSEFNHKQVSPTGSVSSTPVVPTKKPLPDSKVVIGTLKKEHLYADIRAKIILHENGKPDIENFLRRITMGNPYCPTCFRPMDDIKADWRSLDISPVGYYCVVHRTQSIGHYHHILKDAQALVRKKFDDYWKVYQLKIEDLTNGNRHEFVVP